MLWYTTKSGRDQGDEPWVEGDDIHMSATAEDQGISRVIQQLSSRFPQVPVADIETLVADLRAEFDGRKIREFVPLFVERRARVLLSGMPAPG